MTRDVNVVAEQAIRCTVDDATTAQQLAAAIRRRAIPGVINVVPTWRHVVVTLAPGADPDLAAAATRDVEPEAGDSDAPRRHVLAITYDGEDLDRVAAHAGLSLAEVVRRHSERDYVVAFLGFAPGFAYLSGVDPALATPRLATPRRTVAAGAVGIAADVSGIYPVALPGGWNIVGHVDAALFDPSAERPALLMPGDTVRFVPR